MADGEYNVSPIRFNILTRQWNELKQEWEGAALKAFRGDDGRMRLNGIASSTIRDLHGDNMLATAIEDMERAANNNLTIFGNHSYQVPEDVYGSVEKARIRPAGTTDAEGDPIFDLIYDVVINEENDRAVKTWKAIDKNTKLGMSIGAMIPVGGAVRDKKSGALTIAHVDLLETSIVGIPANPRSWIENAVKAFDPNAVKAATTIPVGQPQLTLDADAGTYRIEGRLDGINLSGEDVEIITNSADAEAEGQPVVDAQEPDTGSDVEPDVTDAKVRVIEIDTGDDSGGSSQQEAPHSDPAPEPVSDEDDAEADATVVADATDAIASAQSVMASLDPAVAGTLQQLLTLTQGLTRELSAAIEREREAEIAKTAAERQRDEVAVMAAKLIGGTNQLIQKLADLPVGRRTSFKQAEESFTELEGIYTRDFLTLLRSKNQ